MIQEKISALISKYRGGKVRSDDLDDHPLQVDASAVVHRAQSGRRPSHISDDDLKLLLASNFEVLTAPGGLVEVTDAHREIIAILSTGVCLLATDDLLTPIVIETVRQARSKDVKVTKALRVAKEDLINLYYSDAKKRETRSATSGEDLAKTLISLGELVLRAVELGATDIHMNRTGTECDIRIRQLGAMKLLMKVSAAKADAMMVAAFNSADASDATYNPYVGQFARIAANKLGLPESIQSLRLQYNPLHNNGRQLVLRILTVGDASVHSDVDTLGYSATHVRDIRIMRRKPLGINIISGPTGSGKSTTLQRALIATMRERNDEIAVITIEDPPEYIIPGAAQYPITNVKTQEERTAAFTKAISDAVRSDPDLIMIGEIRDHASASLAFEAAMSGHQVWASLHANSALEILDRLRDLGVELWKLANPGLITGLVGQRLVRKLCPHCKQPIRKFLDPKLGIIDDILLEAIETHIPSRHIDQMRVAKVNGCSRCINGYHSREVVAEIIQPDMTFMDKISDDDRSGAFNYWLENLNGQTALEHSIYKMISGDVDPREVESKVAPIRELRDGRIDKIMHINQVTY